MLSAVLLGFCQGKDADTVRLFMKLKGGASELANHEGLQATIHAAQKGADQNSLGN